MELTRFYDFIHKQIGLDMLTVGTALFERVINERIQAYSLQHGQPVVMPAALEHYWQFVQHNPQEKQALIDAMVIPETSFFRHADSYVLLVAQVQALIARFPTKTIRLLSLPCSTGEEPYSMIMALLDAGIAPHRLSLLAVDVSQQALGLARAGVYGRNSFRSGRRDLRSRYFDMTTDGTYAVQPEIKAAVRFASGNLLNPSLLANEAPFDIIFCRNVLIYFDRDTQLQALKKCKSLLSAWGTLFVAPAEGALLVANGFRQTGQTGAFAYLPDHAQEPHDMGVSATSRTISRLFSPPAVVPRATQPSRAPVLAANQTDVATLDVPPYFAEARRLADLGQFEMALQHCDHWLELYSTDHAAWLLKGIIQDAMGQVEPALTAYRKTLYLEPNHQEALAHMAELFRQQGDLMGAMRLSRRLERLQKYSQRHFDDPGQIVTSHSNTPQGIELVLPEGQTDTVSQAHPRPL